MKPAILLGAGLLFVAGAAFAEPASLPQRYEGILAVGATGVDRPYVGASTDVTPTALLVGQWRNLYFSGDRLLVGLHDGGWWTFAALGQYRYHQYESPDRDRAIELGAALTFPVGAHFLQLSAAHDVIDTHGGTELELRGFTVWTSGRWVLVPALAVQHQSARLADYYFGTPAYTPGRTTNLTGELTAIATVHEPWVAVMSTRSVRHDDAIHRSPAVSGRITQTWTLAFGRRF